MRGPKNPGGGRGGGERRVGKTSHGPSQVAGRRARRAGARARCWPAAALPNGSAATPQPPPRQMRDPEGSPPDSHRARRANSPFPLGRKHWMQKVQA